MKTACIVCFVLTILLTHLPAQTPYFDQTRDGFLVAHPIKTDAAGHIVSWVSDDPATAFDFVIKTVWTFWDAMRRDMNGLPYYMNHQVWRPDINDRRGIGGDQLQMALSSWTLLYQYTGNEKIKENMKFMADYYLSHSLSPADAEWPHIPYPYNTLIYSGFYDGDMVIGKDFTQPDKAGSFGDELVTLYKMTGNDHYLEAAINIANTLARHTKAGDDNFSPLPFKVNALTGEIGTLKSNIGDHSSVGLSSYTSNWVGTLHLFEKLIELGAGDTKSYQNAHDIILQWMIEYPLKTNKWGPFFEDIPGWSDTQINAVTFARYMMLRPERFPDWPSQVKGIFDWVYAKLGNHQWEEYGVTVVNEQTAYQTPGNSHTSRQAAAEILYATMTENDDLIEAAIRRLLWATYMVYEDGKNCYPRDEVWLTDGYGDYVRHFLRAMAVRPQLAPAHADHILHSTSVISRADYPPDLNKIWMSEIPAEEVEQIVLYYKTFDDVSTETIRLTAKPSSVYQWDDKLPERTSLEQPGWTWQPLEHGGVLKVYHTGNTIKIKRE